MLADDSPENEVLVVEAPTESAPTSPAPDEHHDEFFGHGESIIEEESGKPELPPRDDDSPLAFDESKEDQELHRHELGMYT